MRGVIGGMNSTNSAVETVNAAANAIGFAEARAPRPTSEKWRWSGCWSWRIYGCFGSQKHSKRIGHAILVSEATSSQTEAPPARSLGRPPPIAVPFAAPPSSPVSFLPSEPPSAAQSPAGLVSLASISANVYSPGGPHSIFAVGPYAYETQLVSPPAFSTFTTEPSTAPFTPPPESVHLTTPSSPEVPFAKLLDQRFAQSQYEFQTYHFYPGSPLGQLISPGSAMSGSGTSSPFPDHEYFAGGLHYPDVRLAVPSKLLKLQSLPTCGWGTRPGSGTLTPEAIQPKALDTFLLNRQDSTVSPLPSLPNAHLDHEAVVDQHQRVSFEFTAESVIRSVEMGPKYLPKPLKTISSSEGDAHVNSMANDKIDRICQTSSEEGATKRTLSPTHTKEGQRCRQRSVSLGSTKEFNFDNDESDGSHKQSIGSNWWVDEKVVGNEREHPAKNWSFPVTETGVN